MACQRRRLTALVVCLLTGVLSGLGCREDGETRYTDAASADPEALGFCVYKTDPQPARDGTPALIRGMICSPCVKAKEGCPDGGRWVADPDCGKPEAKANRRSRGKRRGQAKRPLTVREQYGCLGEPRWPEGGSED